MKNGIIILLLLQLTSSAQSVRKYEQKLNHLIEKRNYWSDEYDKKFDDTASDSMSYYNTAFEKYLLKVTTTNPESIKNKFKTLQNNYIKILTSADGNFRIYSWDTFEGGTMHFFKNIMQYKYNGTVKAEILNTTNESDEEGDDPSCYFYELNQVTSRTKHFYVTCSVGIGSSADYYYEAKIFSIDNAKLNDKAQLIKTKSGLKNALGYEVDLSNEANRNDTSNIEKRDYMAIEYDKKNKIIVLALLDENEKVTTKKIKYQFSGVYFEKLKYRK